MAPSRLSEWRRRWRGRRRQPVRRWRRKQGSSKRSPQLRSRTGAQLERRSGQARQGSNPRGNPGKAVPKLAHLLPTRAAIASSDPRLQLLGRSRSQSPAPSGSGAMASPAGSSGMMHRLAQTAPSPSQTHSMSVLPQRTATQTCVWLPHGSASAMKSVAQIARRSASKSLAVPPTQTSRARPTPRTPTRQPCAMVAEAAAGVARVRWRRRGAGRRRQRGLGTRSASRNGGDRCGST
jgi:hypothetical protein